ncbi:MAG: hypothetical protein AABX13_05290 [Nanoarchaeota archaeon]
MHLQRLKFKDLEQVPFLNVKQHFKQDFQGSSPAPFIGRFGYPQVNIGILSPQIPGNTSSYDSPRLWSSTAVPIGTIASLRYSLVNSCTRWNVKELKVKEWYKQNQPGKLLEITREVGIAAKPVELEVSLKKLPALPVTAEKEIIPFGPQAEVRRARITENVKVDASVERVVGDTDLKATPALLNLYQRGLEENVLTKILSTGNVGLGRNRKLVPTRWSITAVDDTLGKKLIAEIKQFPPGEYQAYFDGAWGNYYLILFFPEGWSYELFETYLGYKVNPWSTAGNFYSTDYESYAGRKEYAEETAGGYYAARLPILEKMKQVKRQHAALTLRFITSEYNVPLGVFVCREAARKAVQEKPLTFASPALLLSYARDFIQRRFGFDLNLLLNQSKLLKNKRQQATLSQF